MSAPCSQASFFTTINHEDRRETSSIVVIGLGLALLQTHSNTSSTSSFSRMSALRPHLPLSFGGKSAHTTELAFLALTQLLFLRMIVDFIDPDPNGPAFWPALKQLSLEDNSHRQGALARLAAMPGCLRALSQTSHFLRKLTLPQSSRFAHVEVIEVQTVAELGCLREALRASPDLAERVHSFSFTWRMSEFPEEMDFYPEREGSMIDIAVRDRAHIWHDYAQETGSTIEVEHDDDGQISRHFFHDGFFFPEPGDHPMIQGDDPDEHPASYDWEAPKQAQGPDGRGEDLLIKSPDQLIASLVEVVTQLRSLHTVNWTSPITTMPLGVFQGLRKLNRLKLLQIQVSCLRNEVHARE